jgi:ribosomal protein L37AE/L43A
MVNCKVCSAKLRYNKAKGIFWCRECGKEYPKNEIVTPVTDETLPFPV